MENINPRYNIKVVPVTDYEFTHPLSVYVQAARMMGKITTDQAALQWAATQLEFAKAHSQFKLPLRDNGPVFLPFMLN